MLAECGFDEIEVPWRADVFRGAPQDKNSASFGTLGVNFRARKRVATRGQPEAAEVEAEAV
jgi:hypothetical protein